MACSRAAGAGKHLAPVRLQPDEELGVAEQPVFGDLGIAGAELAQRQRVEQRGVGDHQDRLVEGADQVLALRRVDAGLAADRGIDLGEQRGRHLHEIEAAPHARRREAGKIADDAAAERDHEIAALDARRDDRLADLLEGGVVLRALALRHHDARGFDGRRRQRRLHRGEMMLRHRLVGDDGGARAGAQHLDGFAELGDQPAADDDLVGARAERDRHHDRFMGRPRLGHDGFSALPVTSRCFATASMISSTIISCGSSRDCTVTSDWA